jgi:ubiquinol-cytochrome c reductase cytochrome b subunit
MHHWAAAVFIAAMLTHSLRIFFTGCVPQAAGDQLADRCRDARPRLGRRLRRLLPSGRPLSGTGLRFVDGLIRAIPLVGTWVEFFAFGGEFPGELIIPRLYMLHILLIPALLLGLIAAHLALVVYHKHTQYPGARQDAGNVVGYPVFPVYAARPAASSSSSSVSSP